MKRYPQNSKVIHIPLPGGLKALCNTRLRVFFSINSLWTTQMTGNSPTLMAAEKIIGYTFFY